MSTLPRAAHAPLTAKRPEACPHCGGRNLVRRGTRKKKLEIVQLWRCASCKRSFTPGPAALRNKTYPLRMILTALTDYDTGYTLEKTAARLEKKTHRNVSPSTIAAWLQEYKRHCSYRRLRAQGIMRFPPAQTVRTIKLYHRQIYSYAYHRPKLEFLRAGTLDDKRKGDTRLAPLADFLERVPADCPHELFKREADPKARASQAAATFTDTSHAIVNVRNNAATDMPHRGGGGAASLPKAAFASGAQSIPETPQSHPLAACVACARGDDQHRPPRTRRLRRAGRGESAAQDACGTVAAVSRVLSKGGTRPPKRARPNSPSPHPIITFGFAPHALLMVAAAARRQGTSP
jgi:transposase-like protein